MGQGFLCQHCTVAVTTASKTKEIFEKINQYRQDNILFPTYRATQLLRTLALSFKFQSIFDVSMKFL